MISWQKNNETSWVIKANNKTMRLESWEKVILACVVLEIPWREIETAWVEMNMHDHNYVEFGIRRKFTFSDVR